MRASAKAAAAAAASLDFIGPVMLPRLRRSALRAKNLLSERPAGGVMSAGAGVAMEPSGDQPAAAAADAAATMLAFEARRLETRETTDLAAADAEIGALASAELRREYRSSSATLIEPPREARRSMMEAERVPAMEQRRARRSASLER